MGGAARLRLVGQADLPNNVTRRWVYPACEVLGLQPVNWLTLRRTYSSWAYDKGVPGKVIAQLMGHAEVDTTLNVYAQVIDGSLRKAAAKPAPAVPASNAPDWSGEKVAWRSSRIGLGGF